MKRRGGDKETAGIENRMKKERQASETMERCGRGHVKELCNRMQGIGRVGGGEQ